MNKFKLITFILISFLLTQCSSQDDKSDAYGNFEADEITISSEVSGRVISLNLEEGQQVAQDELIAVIDTTQITLKIQELKEKLHALEATKNSVKNKILAQEERIKTIRTEKRRVQKLLEDSAATDKQWDDILGKLRVAEANLKSLHSELDKVEYNKKSAHVKLRQLEDKLDKCYVKNPYKGTILEKYINKYEISAPGKPLYKIADLEDMYLRAYLSGEQISQIQLGQQVTVKFDKNEEQEYSIPGEVTWIADEAEFTPKIIQTKDVRVDLVYAAKIKVNNDGRIKIGMPGEVVFEQ